MTTSLLHSRQSLKANHRTRPSTTSAPPQQSTPPARPAAPDASILAKQRLNRPVSPNIGIYRAQITWYMSGFNRITGSILSGAFYVFGFGYLVAPLFGWHIESPALAAAVGSLPIVAKVALKFGVAFPFTFHSFNGLRHLVWDSGRGFANQTVIRSGWFVVGLSTVSAAVLALI